MRKLQIISSLILAITVIIMAINVFVTELSDTVIRINGIIMLIATGFTSYFSIRNIVK